MGLTGELYLRVGVYVYEYIMLHGTLALLVPRGADTYT